jgi:putative two-component system protein, hydrogenase maturation factor HypX/HoxX
LRESAADPAVADHRRSALEADGYVVVPTGLPASILEAVVDDIWRHAGAAPDDPATWYQPATAHYRLMGLHGSEYWTYTLPRRLPRRVGAEQAARLTHDCLPISPTSALRCGLIDRVITGGIASYHAQVSTLASQLAYSPDHSQRIAAKARQLAEAEKRQPLAAYRATELAIMGRNFSTPGEPYPQLRRAFVHKHKPTGTPSHLTRDPARPGRGGQRRGSSPSSSPARTLRTRHP